MKNWFLVVLAGVFAPNVTFSQDTCDTVADCAQSAMEAAFEAKLALQVAVPKGAVMPFNLSECPTGWSLFAPLSGRVVVGAGTGDGLTARTTGQQGGAETHTLTAAQMPKHSHGYRSTDNGTLNDNGSNFAGGAKRFGVVGDKTSSEAGSGQAHNIMQPYHVLLYCERQ